MEREVYGHVLERLEEAGLGMRESVRRVRGGGVVEKSLERRWRVMGESV